MVFILELISYSHKIYIRLDFKCSQKKNDIPDTFRAASLICRVFSSKAQRRWNAVEYLKALTNGASFDHIRSRPSPSERPQSSFSRGLYSSWHDHWCTYEWNTLVPNLSCRFSRAREKKFLFQNDLIPSQLSVLYE